ncbi:MAG TPA: class I SAM-dependent methyltransferase [Bryobacteraceae bacterium]|nr:class I SAM-dependent methyltransferase [Bryobacteraceae bacterium]
MNEGILGHILEVSAGLHSAGTFSPRTLEAIARKASRRRISNSVETGCGASTLLLSHLSDHHTVFAMDAASGSVTNVRRSALLRASAVTFVEGPTQATLPRHRFEKKLQLVLLDGPHAYPFPDLEYYFLYPHLETGALLILDDIHIPTVHNLFEFLRRDAMFDLDEVVQTTAFFTRTSAPTFDPLGDGWSGQNYNANPLLRYTWRSKIKSLLPGSLKRSVRMSQHCPLEILTPRSGSTVGASGTVEGTAVLPADTHLWILAHRRDIGGWWPQGGGAVPVQENRWRIEVTYGGPQDAGCDFEIAALAVGPATHQLWSDWVARVNETGLFPPVQFPLARYLRGGARRVVRRA